MEIKDKVDYVLGQGQTRDHHCHWPGCEESVPPAKWGCTKHWYMLPQSLRNKVWEAYEPGQEVNCSPTREYVAVAREVQEWIREFLDKQNRIIVEESAVIPEVAVKSIYEPNIKYVTNVEDIPHTISGSSIYVDIETYGINKEDKNSPLDIHTAQIRLISVTGGEDNIIYVFDLYYIPIERILEFFKSKVVVGHNLIFDLSILHRFGLPLPEYCRDTMVESTLLIAGLPDDKFGGSTLPECLKRYIKVDINKGYGDSDWSAPELSSKQILYAAEDVRWLPILAADLTSRLNKWELKNVAELENGIIPAIVDMTLRGVAIDVDEWRKRSLEAANNAKEIGKIIREELPLPPEEPEKIVRYKRDGQPYKKDIEVNERIREANKVRAWNLGSPIQMLDVFRQLNIAIKDTKYETLMEKRLEYPIIDKFLQWREREKESTTFGEQWLKHLRGDRVHPNWRQLGAKNSGRMSCGDPNMQQIPRGKCRKGIIASPGHLLIRGDFSQIEARIAAKISKDEVLIELFNSGGDIHSYTAKSVLQKESVTEDDRQIGKSLLFGLLFSMSADHLKTYCAVNYGVKLSSKEAELFRDRFFRTFPGIQRWHNRTRNTCEGKTEVRTLLGRRRLVGWGNENVNMLGLALNTPVQGSAADMLKMSVREYWARRYEEPYAKLLMLVHDEIVLEAPEEIAERVGVWLKSMMMDAGRIILDPIPVDVKVKIGRSWGG